MAFSLNLHPLPEFDPDIEVGASLSTRWRQWLRDFDTYLLASGIRDLGRKRAILLHQAGSRVREIFSQIPDTGDAADYELARDKLTAYFEPQTNRRYEVYKFRQTRQEQGETLDHFHTRLRHLSVNCTFTDTDFEIEEQIIVGGISNKIRRKALRDPDYSLKDMLLDGRRDEMSEFQAKEIESKEDMQQYTHRFTASNKAGKQKLTVPPKCGSCGGARHPKDQCPAYGKTCHKCAKSNHFAAVCRSAAQDKRPKSGRPNKPQRFSVKPLNYSTQSSNDEYVYTIQQKSTGCPTTTISIAGKPIPIMIDTGASINVLDNTAFQQLEGIELRPTKVKAFAFSSKQPVCFKGKFEALVETKQKYCVSTFYVVSSKDSGCLLSMATAQELGLISLNLSAIKPVDVTDEKLSTLLDKYRDVFKGLGKLRDTEVQLNVKYSSSASSRYVFNCRVVLKKKHLPSSTSKISILRLPFC